MPLTILYVGVGQNLLVILTELSKLMMPGKGKAPHMWLVWHTWATQGPLSGVTQAGPL